MPRSEEFKEWSNFPPSKPMKGKDAPGGPRVKTYVEGLDEKMEGGIPEGNLVLMAGEALGF